MAIFRSVGFDHLGCRYVMPLVAMRGDRLLPSGSSCLINNAMALTARHVIDDYLDQFGHAQLAGDNVHIDASFNLQGITIAESPDQARLWNVRHIGATKFSDCVILQVETYGEIAPEERGRLIVSIEPPEVGSKVFAFGYREPKTEILDERVKFGVDPIHTEGIVLQVEPKGFPSKCNFPCFVTDFRSDPSMSGGPVFNSNGHLCGVISASFEAANEDDPQTTICSLIWPSLNISIQVPKDIDQSGQCRMLDLANRGIVRIEGLERIKYERKDQGYELTMRY